MRGYFNQNARDEGTKMPVGRLNINVTNLPEFYELVEQAKNEADQLQRTIDKLRYFELNIDFSTGESTSSES